MKLFIKTYRPYFFFACLAVCIPNFALASGNWLSFNDEVEALYYYKDKVQAPEIANAGKNIAYPVLKQCNSDLLPDFHQNAILERVNYYRRVAGVAPVTLRKTDSAIQRASTMLLYNGDAEHFPEESWECYSPNSAEIIKHSSIGFTPENITATTIGLIKPENLIDRWINIANTNYRDRTLLLHPELSSISAGYVQSALSGSGVGALVLNYKFMEPAYRPAYENLTRDGYVAWPPRYDYTCDGCVFSITIPVFSGMEKITLENINTIAGGIWATDLKIIEQNGWVTFFWGHNGTAGLKDFDFKYNCRNDLLDDCTVIKHQSSSFSSYRAPILFQKGKLDQYFKTVIGETKEVAFYDFKIHKSDYLMFDPQKLSVTVQNNGSLSVSPLKSGSHTLTAIPEGNINKDPIPARRKVMFDVSSKKLRLDSWLLEADRLMDKLEENGSLFIEAPLLDFQYYYVNHWPKRYFNLETDELHYSEEVELEGIKAYGRPYQDAGQLMQPQTIWKFGAYYCGDLYMIPQSESFPQNIPSSPYRGAYIKLAQNTGIQLRHPVPCSQTITTHIGTARRLKFINPTSDLPYIESCTESLVCGYNLDGNIVKLNKAEKDYIELEGIAVGNQKIKVSLDKGRYFFVDVVVENEMDVQAEKLFKLNIIVKLFDMGEYFYPELLFPPYTATFSTLLSADNTELYSVYRMYNNNVLLGIVFNTNKKLSCVYLYQQGVYSLLGKLEDLATSAGIGDQTPTGSESCPEFNAFVPYGKLP